MSTQSNIAYDSTIEQLIFDFKIKDGYIFRGVVASLPMSLQLQKTDEPKAYGSMQPPPIGDDVAPYSIIDNKKKPNVMTQGECG